MGKAMLLHACFLSKSMHLQCLLRRCHPSCALQAQSSPQQMPCCRPTSPTSVLRLYRPSAPGPFNQATDTFPSLLGGSFTRCTM